MTQSKEKFETRKLPMMPIRDVVIFPHMMTPFVVGRESSVRALEEALASDRKIFLATQHDASIDEPKANEIYQIGTVVNIVQSLKLPDGNIKVLVEGIERAKVLQIGHELPAVALAGASLSHFARQRRQAQLIRRLMSTAGLHEQSECRRFEPRHLLSDEGQTASNGIAMDFLRHEACGLLV